MKKLQSKLAAGVRKVKEGQGSAASPAPSSPTGKPAAPTPKPTRSAPRQNVYEQQNPSPTLDNPWANLHPRRIWPD